MSGTGPARKIVPMGMLGLGIATGFVLRDEINMPTYMRIKMALVEHSILTRKKLNSDVLALLDPNHGKLRLMRQQEITMLEREKMLKELKEASSNKGEEKKEA